MDDEDHDCLASLSPTMRCSEYLIVAEQEQAEEDGGHGHGRRNGRSISERRGSEMFLEKERARKGNGRGVSDSTTVESEKALKVGGD